MGPHGVQGVDDSSAVAVQLEPTGVEERDGVEQSRSLDDAEARQDAVIDNVTASLRQHTARIVRVSPTAACVSARASSLCELRF
ncbi:hypothetical protein FGB62_71g28 [Gracilaria domingensis]|nr:hypothetical protein FGB62_71g28 [Gracilaria domingensis]